MKQLYNYNIGCIRFVMYVVVLHVMVPVLVMLAFESMLSMFNLNISSHWKWHC